VKENLVLQRWLITTTTFWKQILQRRSDQKEMLFKAPDLSSENLKHLLGLAKRNPVCASLHSKEGEENILRSWDAEIIAQQLESPHEGIRIGVDLRRGQLGPAKHIPLEIGERKLESHVFESHLIHGKDMILVLQTPDQTCSEELTPNL
jgi:hypothetical protein